MNMKYLKYIEKASDMIAIWLSIFAVVPIIFTMIIAYSYTSMFLAKEGVYFPWFVDHIFSISTIILMMLLAFFFASIGESAWKVTKKSLQKVLNL